MKTSLSTSLLLPTMATLASASSPCIKAVSWGDPRVDLFGWAPDQSIWHKFYTGYDWQPRLFERIPSESAGCPSVSSWDQGRLDILWVNRSDETVLHKYFDGGSWGPSWEGTIDLGSGGGIGSIDSYSWGKKRLDIIGNAPNGSVVHKAWTGQDYYPTGLDWENLGGNFTDLPAVGSWGENRLDLAGISAETGSLIHRFWDGGQWTDWEDLGGSFTGRPVISSWGTERLDLWTLDEAGGLNHKYWDGYQWSDWEQLGGKFSQTPEVVHWSPGRIDIVGKNVDDNFYYLKSYDGYNWNPSVNGWYDLSGPYSSEPSLVVKAKGQNFLYLFGVDTDNSLRMQLWSGQQWEPDAKGTWPLGDLSEPYSDKNSDSFLSETQHVLLGAEL
ncbi:hypothetical protein F4802DRAFT_555030 [Xylaria palmicola]|nr:hypothetical protein F4802DRAFT_555030 [Xylaria palmicola]